MQKDIDGNSLPAINQIAKSAALGMKLVVRT